MSDQSRPIDALISDLNVPSTQPEPQELSVEEKAKFRQLLQNKRATFVANGLKRFKSFQEAYDRLLIPVFKEADRTPAITRASEKVCFDFRNLDTENHPLNRIAKERYGAT